MPRFLVLFAAALALATSACGGQEQQEDVILATTTSTQDSGLLDALVPAFQEETGYAVKTVAVGSGEAIELGGRGEADVVLAHAPSSEEELVATGKTGERLLVMHNDFFVVGPADDPAGVGEAATAVEAMEAIAGAEAPFVSRGDDSGTHQLELQLWEEAGIQPAGDWYQESGQGMGQTIQIASEQGAYTIADRGTYLATGDGNDLEVLFEGDPALLNVYHVIPITKAAGERVNEEGGAAFAEWLVSPEAQDLIGDFGVAEFGRPLFVPDAGKSEAEVAQAA
jgi:tungstate transport system substrate-binding protein